MGSGTHAISLLRLVAVIGFFSVAPRKSSVAPRPSVRRSKVAGAIFLCCSGDRNPVDFGNLGRVSEGTRTRCAVALALALAGVRIAGKFNTVILGRGNALFWPNKLRKSHSRNPPKLPCRSQNSKQHMAGLLLRRAIALEPRWPSLAAPPQTGVLAGALTCALTGAPESAPQKGQKSRAAFLRLTANCHKSCPYSHPQCVRSADRTDSPA